jgi:hypothetical protein
VGRRAIEAAAIDCCDPIVRRIVVGTRLVI